MDQQSKQNVLDLPKVIAGGLASPVAALLTSHFGVAGTLVGLALSAVIVTVLTDILKVYLARAPGTVTSLPGGFTKKPGWRTILGRIRLPFSKFSSLAPVRRRSILLGSVLAGGIAFLIGLSVVTGLELSAGKNLSCWVWKDCPTVSSTGGKASSTSTLPSIFGGRQAVSSNVLRAWPSNPQQQPTPGVPVSPSPSPGVPGSETPTPSVPQPGQRQSPSGVPEDQQQGSSEAQQNQQQNPTEYQENQQQSPTRYQEGQQQQPFRVQNPQPNLSGGSKDQQQEPPTPPAPQDYGNR